MPLDEWNLNLRLMLMRHEGVRLTPYRCPAGKLTIGCGRNLQDVGITQLEAMTLLSNDIERVTKEAHTFGWFKSLNRARQDVVISMIFNLGLPRFKEFKKTIEAINMGNFSKAADEMLDSSWAKQVGERAIDLADMMKRGSY